MQTGMHCPVAVYEHLIWLTWLRGLAFVDNSCNKLILDMQSLQRSMPKSCPCLAQFFCTAVIGTMTLVTATSQRSMTYICQNHLPLKGNEGQALKAEVGLVAEFEGRVGLRDVQ